MSRLLEDSFCAVFASTQEAFGYCIVYIPAFLKSQESNMQSPWTDRYPKKLTENHYFQIKKTSHSSGPLWECSTFQNSTELIGDSSWKSRKSQGKHPRTHRSLLSLSRSVIRTLQFERHGSKMASMEERWDKNHCLPEEHEGLSQFFQNIPWWYLNPLRECSVGRWVLRQACCYILQKPKTAVSNKNIIPTVKHSGGNVMAWGWTTC